MTQIPPLWVSDNSPIDDPHGRGKRAVEFFKALKHPKSELPKHAFGIPDFWERIIKRIYGPSDEFGNRLVRTVYIQIPRGARKTTIGAGLGLLHSFGPERIPGGLCLLSAGAEDQAEIAFDEIKGFVNTTAPLGKNARVVDSELEIEHMPSGSIVQAIPAEGDTRHGFTPHFILIDELHIWKNRRLWRALKSSLLKIPNTLLVIISTAGLGQNSLGYEEYTYAKKVAQGIIKNPAYLSIIFEPPEGYDWQDQKIWHLVNPGLKQNIPDLIGMRQAALEARDKPSDRDEFKAYNLNEWQAESTAPLVSMDLYDKCNGAVDLEALKGEPCWLGVDLSSVGDLSVIVAAFRDPEIEDGFIVWPWFFCPKHGLRRRGERDGVNYIDWEKRGFITATEGSTIDHRVIEQKIRELCEQYRVEEINFDLHLAQRMMSDLLEDGLPAIEFRQVPSLMMGAIQEVERVVIGGKLKHGGHPILRWNFSNVEVVKNRMGHKTHLTKSKETLRIDGVVGAAMAIARAAKGSSAGRSIYEDDSVSIEDLVW